MRKFYLSGIVTALLTCLSITSSAKIPQRINAAITPVSTDTLFYVDFKNLPAAFTTGDIFTASTGNIGKEQTINGITFGAGPNGQRINMNTSQSANQYGSGATQYVSATADDDGSTAGAFSFLRTGTGSASGGYIILPDVQGPSDITIWSCGANTGNTQRYELLASQDNGSNWTSLGTFSMTTLKLIYKNVFKYEGNGTVRIKLLCTTGSSTNCNLYIYNVLMTKRPSLVLSSAIGTNDQTVTTALNESINDIVYTWGSIATSTNITWTGTVDANTPPAGISVITDTNAKTVTISGTPTETGTYGYSITATDGTISTSAQTGNIKVVDTPIPLIQLTSAAGTNIQSIVAGNIMDSIQYTWGGSATTANISWTGTSSSETAPDGIVVTKDPTNEIVILSGTPVTPGVYTWKISSTEGTLVSEELTGQITVIPPPTIELTSESTTLEQTVAFCQSIIATVYTYGGSATTTNLVWSGTPGSTTPPPGITVTTNTTEKTITIAGMPYLTGNYSYTITSTDGNITSQSITGKIISSATTDALVSFPGAVGYGSHATGGRKGTVYHVTNLNDSGTGSFRDAVSSSNRIIVFDVSGYINLTSAVSCKSNLTIAGQTAPGEGIGFRGGEISFANQQNIICRDIRIVPGSETESTTDDALSLYLARNVIMDHCTFEFAPWNNIDGVSDNYQVYPVTGITLQNCIDANPTGQQFGAHCESVLSQWTFYRNLFANSHNRNPLAKINEQFINNVHYNNEAGYTTHTSTTFKHDLINNYFIGGPASSSSTSFPWFQVDGNQSFYIQGNLYDGNKDGLLNGTATDIYWYSGTGTFLTAPWSPLTTSLPTVDASSAYRIVVSTAGTQPLSQLDSLVINQVKTLGSGTTGYSAGTVGPSGGLYTDQTQTGLSNNGYGVIRSGVKATDTDNDGMPDFWEAATGSNVNSDDAMQIGTDGYTLIENYLNWLADLHATTGLNGSIDIDLNSVSGGFSAVSPVFTTANDVNGTSQLLEDGHTVRFTPAQGFSGIASFGFTVTGSDNTSYTNKISILVGTTEISGIKELKNDISFYPNPTKDKIILQNVNAQSFVIYNATGKTVMNGDFNQSGINKQINVSNLNAGMYILQLSDKSKSSVQFIKK